VPGQEGPEDRQPNDGVAAVAAQGGRAEDARATEGQQQDGNLEHRAEGEHRHELEAVVGARA
jgi:hypothetical protein